MWGSRLLRSELNFPRWGRLERLGPNQLFDSCPVLKAIAPGIVAVGVLATEADILGRTPLHCPATTPNRLVIMCGAARMVYAFGSGAHQKSVLAKISWPP